MKPMSQRLASFLTLGCFLLTSTGCMTAVAAFQPELGDTIVLTTTDADGTSHDRVLSPIDDGDTLYVSVNHWPRAWYHRALANPEVRVTRGGTAGDYTAVHLTGDDRERFIERFPRPLLVSALMGFAPREIFRLDPR